jgi:ERCC4-type nuclease
MTKSGITELLEKLAGKRKTQKKKDSVLSRLKKKTSSTEKRALDAAALVAATRRVDYTRLVRERAKIGEFLEKATADYKSVEERMKAIEKDELAKVVTQLSKPRWGFFW